VLLIFTLYLLCSLFHFFGRTMALLLNLASGLVELGTGLAVELFDAMLDLLGCMLGLALHFTAGFAGPFLGSLFI